jgi:hypothetical protein
MSRQAMKVERFLRQRFTGCFAFTDGACLKCDKNDDNKIMNIKRIDVEGKDVSIDFQCFGDNDEKKNSAYAWMKKSITNLINYGTNYFNINFHEITKHDLIRRDMVREFHGNNRYRNHDYIIKKIGLRFVPKKQRDSWRLYEMEGDETNLDTYTIDVVFKMRNFRGDRDFIFDHIKQMISDHINHEYPGRHIININVRMDKP